MTNFNIIDAETLITRKKNIIISTLVNTVNAILKRPFMDYSGMVYFVLKNVLQQASIFALICSLYTGDGSHDSNT
jgi:hypothetical protein